MSKKKVACQLCFETWRAQVDNSMVLLFLVQATSSLLRASRPQSHQVLFVAHMTHFAWLFTQCQELLCWIRMHWIPTVFPQAKFGLSGTPILDGATTLVAVWPSSSIMYLAYRLRKSSTYMLKQHRMQPTKAPTTTRATRFRTSEVGLSCTEITKKSSPVTQPIKVSHDVEAKSFWSFSTVESAERHQDKVPNSLWEVWLLQSNQMVPHRWHADLAPDHILWVSRPPSRRLDRLDMPTWCAIPMLNPGIPWWCLAVPWHSTG